MTRPVGGKPESTQDRYDDVHSVGSSFGADLDEKAVRSLLGNQVENPFASIVTGLANTVVDILESVANGILGIFKPGDKESPIRDAIVAVMEPMESQVFELGKRLNTLSTEAMEKIEAQGQLIRNAESELSTLHTLLQEQKAYEEATRKALGDAEIAIGEAEAWMGINEEKIDEAQNKALASHQILFNEQTGWNKTQEKITESLVSATEANAQALKLQENLNLLFQEQLWAQLDMIEQGEIQRPRVYHQAVDDGPLITNIPSWVGWSSAREYKNTFINFYHRYSDTKTVKWQATGRWEGQVRLTTNWDNGAVDTFVYDIYVDRITRGDRTWSGRTMSLTGGAAFVYHRNTTFEVYPRNLGRQVGVFISTKDDGTGTRWVDEDAPSMNQPLMIRYKSEDMFRLAASVTSDKEVTTRVYQDGEWVKKVYAPNTIIPPSMIWREDMPTGMTYFMETNFHDKTLK